MYNATTRIIGIILLLSVLSSCGIKWATNRVLSNPDAVTKVGEIYDRLHPRDTAERIVFIAGDTIFSVTHDTAIIKDHIFSRDTIRITTTKRIVSTDTIIRTLPPDNRALARISDSLALYRSLAANYAGNSSATTKQLKTAETRLIWMAGILLLAGVVIGILVRFKLKP